MKERVGNVTFCEIDNGRETSIPETDGKEGELSVSGKGEGYNLPESRLAIRERNI